MAKKSKKIVVEQVDPALDKEFTALEYGTAVREYNAKKSSIDEAMEEYSWAGKNVTDLLRCILRELVMLRLDREAKNG